MASLGCSFAVGGCIEVRVGWAGCWGVGVSDSGCAELFLGVHNSLEGGFPVKGLSLKGGTPVSLRKFFAKYRLVRPVTYVC